jgi:tetratricopeptide (TPR) repeat protein
MRKKIGVLCCCIFMAGIFARSMGEDLKKAILLHDSAALESNADKALACQELLQPYIEKDAVCRAYYGSAVTVEASFYEKSNPIKALSLLDKGSEYIDSAVEMDSDNFIVRILRLTNGVQVSSSSPLKRYKVIKNDVAWFEKNGIDYGKDENARLYYNIALFHLAVNNLDAALYALDDCIATKSSDPVVKKAQELLRRYEE